jgi:hypothetical protein
MTKSQLKRKLKKVKKVIPLKVTPAMEQESVHDCLNLPLMPVISASPSPIPITISATVYDTTKYTDIDIFDIAPYMFTTIKSIVNQYGIQCDNGWYWIIYKLMMELRKMDTTFKCIRVQQIKEKLGGFRFYFEIKPPKYFILPVIKDMFKKRMFEYFYPTVQYYTDIIETHCELCGKPNATLCTKNHWLKTVCPACKKKEKYKKAKSLPVCISV